MEEGQALDTAEAGFVQDGSGYTLLEKRDAEYLGCPGRYIKAQYQSGGEYAYYETVAILGGQGLYYVRLGSPHADIYDGYVEDFLRNAAHWEE